MGTGMAWDCSMGVLCDFAGNDHYMATGGSTQGTGAQMGFGILFDYNGDDVYEGYGQGYANPGISYHHLPECGGNFSFLVDYGGNDTIRLRRREQQLHPARRLGRFPDRSSAAGRDRAHGDHAGRPTAGRTAGIVEPRREAHGRSFDDRVIRRHRDRSSEASLRLVVSAAFRLEFSAAAMTRQGRRQPPSATKRRRRLAREGQAAVSARN